MLIKRLKLQNFVIFRDVDLDFNSVNLTSIAGRWSNDRRRSNGAGKSALLESIPYALFGTTRSKQKMDIVRRGADRCVVEIQFTAGGKDIRVERQRSRDGTSNARIWIDGKLSGQQVRNVDAVVKQCLGVDPDLFELIYFFRQDDQFRFVNASPGERKSYLAKVFDLGAVEACLALAKAQHKEAIEAQQRAEGAVQALYDSLGTMAPRAALEDQLLDDYDALSSATIAVMSRSEYHSDLQGHIDDARKMLDEYDRETAETMREIHALQKEFQDNIQQIAQLTGTLQLNEGVLAQHKEALKSIDTGTADMTRSIAEWQQMLDAAKEREYEIVGKLARFDHSVACDRQEMIESKELAGVTCPTCNQLVPADHVEKILKDAEERIKKAVKERADEAQKRQMVKFEIKNNEQGLKRRQDAENAQLQAARMQGLVDTLAKTVGSERRRLKELEERQPQINERLAILTSNVNVGGSAQARNELEQKINAFASSILRLNIDTGDLAAKVARSESLIEQYDQLQGKIQDAEQAVQLKKRLVQVQSSLVDIFGKNGLQAILIENVISVIEQFANDILKQMQTRFEVSLRTQKEIKSGEQKETLEVVVFDNGEERMFETYSGGERTLINLALRLSLSRIISSLHGVVMHSLFLDEVLAALDEVNREEAIKVVAFLSKSFEQVFVISHTNEVKDIIPGQILIDRFEEHSEVVINNARTDVERVA